MEGKVFYVWFDAPIEYIASAQEWVDADKGTDWERWWRTDKGADDVRYTQFMGKDNVPFHTLGFPATIMGADQDWKLVDYIKSFNYLNYDGGQFSTSRGRGVFMDQALEILPADVWRWWLLSHAPETSDAEFTWDTFQQDVNKDLADVLGNFVSRVTKFCRSKFSEAVPEGGDYGDAETALIAELTEKVKTYEAHMGAIEVRKAAAALRAIWVAGNEYLQAQAPWTTIKEDPAKAEMQVRLGLNLIRLYGIPVGPLYPDHVPHDAGCDGRQRRRLAFGRGRGLDRPAAWPWLHGAREPVYQDHRRPAGGLGVTVCRCAGLTATDGGKLRDRKVSWISCA